MDGVGAVSSVTVRMACTLLRRFEQVHASSGCKLTCFGVAAQAQSVFKATKEIMQVEEIMKAVQGVAQDRRGRVFSPASGGNRGSEAAHATGACAECHSRKNGAKRNTITLELILKL